MWINNRFSAAVVVANPCRLLLVVSVPLPISRSRGDDY